MMPEHSLEEDLSIMNIFNDLRKSEGVLKKTLMHSAALLLSVFIVGIGFSCGYLYRYVKQLLDTGEDNLPRWEIMNIEDLKAMYISGWRAFLPLLPFIVLLTILYLTVPHRWFIIPVLMSVLSFILIPYVFIRYASRGSIKETFSPSVFFIFLKERFLYIGIALVISLLLFAVSLLGILFIIGFFFTFSWFLVIILNMWTRIYKFENKNGGHYV